ncbi:IS630 family transposase [Endozoicomonas gorgoniicola]|uniref:IS630 family transposase n=1 Tax=Endozoicomonas gorgoniicola TaxID=1234144 RepID=A0ABT3MW56_9GAMM|nr:IS630 family transposase [Endozoicomonas gorgoniicola]MCW7551201.1 IS630 family transposase [Endozoicomonas gorgoniicola]MCW7551653.1 IS630 family transposase [Endozoicomonas gorgoniicola]MCW7552637.1 IS630 family transposase [Endozoicomonas gorgoniicola]MCW7553321.1 IS630 family transposase [Endozoicomonas gorgoniicola]MCW7553590.1 IS630 family transposase [Endozoicomonas gorgoniicola]
MKTVLPITDGAIRETLQIARSHGPTPYVRERAHAVLLSSRGFPMAQIADIFEVQYQTVSRWLDDWEDYGIRGLYKTHDGGKKPIYNSEEELRIKELVAKEPRRISYVQSKIEEETGKSASKTTIGRIIKKLGMVYKRLRKSCKHKRDEEQFQRSKAALKDAQEAEDKGLINLFYFDESGFSQEPCVPYGWQEKGKQLRIPSVKSKRINVLGFMNRSCELFYYPVIGSVDSKTVIDIFDYFAYQMTAPEYGGDDRYTVVIIDNASIHTSKAFRARIDDWILEKKMIVLFLPTYSPELNLIEILWDKAKYEWIDILSIVNFRGFEKEVKRVFDGVGQEYMISYA